MKTRIKPRIKKITDINKHLAERIETGLKNVHAKEISSFIIQNLAEGFARGIVKELKSGHNGI